MLQRIKSEFLRELSRQLNCPLFLFSNRTLSVQKGPLIAGNKATLLDNKVCRGLIIVIVLANIFVEIVFKFV